MAETKRYTFRKILVASVWILLSAGLIVLLVAAITKKNNEVVSRIDIHIEGVQNHYFINKNDVMRMLQKVHGKELEKAIVGTLDLVTMERTLQKNQWIKRAVIFFDNNNVLQIKITEREPVARIFTISGESFYIDSSLKRLPLSDKFSVRIPVFTNFPTNNKVWSSNDSLLGNEIKLLGEYIGNDPFWMAQVDQVDITPSRTFELIPKLGNQVIRFGSVENYKEKFNKLFAFYKQVQTRTGWNRYSVLDIQYKDQVVAINRNKQEIIADSLKAIQIMKEIIEEANKKINDTTQVQLPQKEEGSININQSRVIDEVPEESGMQNNLETKGAEVNKPITNVPPVKPGKPEPAIKKSPAVTIKKPVAKKTAVKKEVNPKSDDAIKKEPKAIMPPKSDY